MSLRDRNLTNQYKSNMRGHLRKKPQAGTPAYQKRIFVLLSLCLTFSVASAQEDMYNSQIVDGQSCTSIMVGKKASADGSVITSHTCDGRYRTWMTMEPACDYRQGALHVVRKGTMHTAYIRLP